MVVLESITKCNQMETNEEEPDIIETKPNYENTGPLKFHYSDIRNRNFQTKFMNHFRKNPDDNPEVDSLAIVHESRNNIDLDISYSEVIVGSTKTIY